MGTYDNIIDLLEVIKSQKFNYYLVIIDNDHGKEKINVFSSLDETEKTMLLNRLNKKNNAK